VRFAFFHRRRDDDCSTLAADAMFLVDARSRKQGDCFFLDFADRGVTFLIFESLQRSQTV
jgi:hypothetical protein